MNTFSKFTGVALATLIMGGCSTTSAPNSSSNGVVTQPKAVKTSSLDGTYAPAKDRIRNHIYLGFGLGLSNLDPDASQSAAFDVNDRVQNAGLINGGVDLSRQVALDFQAVNLGSAGFSPSGDIEYREFNGSALFYVGKNRHRFKRRGFTGFGRIGAGYLDNTSNGVPFDQVNGFHFLLGLGAEFMTSVGLGVRAEVISYDEDINLAQLGLIYRFGRQERRELVQTVAAPIPEPVPVVVPEPEPAPVIEAALPVSESCLALNGVAEGVTFHSDSAVLTAESQNILGNFAATFEDCDNAFITVTAHTDSQGAEAYNEQLSQQRANSVVTFFEQNGIDTTRMDSIAFGETLPIDTNDTAQGRARNRRVELIVNEAD